MQYNTVQYIIIQYNTIIVKEVCWSTANRHSSRCFMETCWSFRGARSFHSASCSIAQPWGEVRRLIMKAYYAKFRSGVIRHCNTDDVLALMDRHLLPVLTFRCWQTHVAMITGVGATPGRNEWCRLTLTLAGTHLDNCGQLICGLFVTVIGSWKGVLCFCQELAPSCKAGPCSQAERIHAVLGVGCQPVGTTGYWSPNSISTTYAWHAAWSHGGSVIEMYVKELCELMFN